MRLLDDAALSRVRQTMTFCGPFCFTADGLFCFLPCFHASVCGGDGIETAIYNYRLYMYAINGVGISMRRMGLRKFIHFFHKYIYVLYKSLYGLCGDRAIWWRANALV